ncbi:hypothetical protein SCHPADRAFT_992061 [Schizopora paradoxa]|uniref:LYR motif-containing protein Cup1-like N-terminal domain-containing protein n=1 Tax=Schizopora paradoxa TaxID=27342 RepID=A0A0H2S8Y0_9AGAM|nr:hypothetical protein SCHPADRAFT_992061 [Schizopora paradoxa]
MSLSSINFQARFAARCLYRSLFRETRKLPYDYLRFFYRIKFRDEFAANPHSTSQEIRFHKSKEKRLNQELRKLRDANEGDPVALEYVLDNAYGRKGKLTHELMEPFINTPKSEMPPPMIQGVEKSRPPVYSPPLRALMTSGLSRRTKVLTPEKIDKPTLLPARADPKSEEARMLGPLSKRRHVNFLWRNFNHEVSLTIPPVSVELSQRGRSNEGDLPGSFSSPPGSASGSSCPGITLGGFQGAEIVGRLRSMAGAAGQHRTLTRRERRAHSDAEVSSDSSSTSLLPTRRLRRSHRWLLGKLPLLEYRMSEEKSGAGKGRPLYSVSLASEALRILRYKARRQINPVDHAWILHGRKVRDQERARSLKSAKTTPKPPLDEQQE